MDQSQGGSPANRLEEILHGGDMDILKSVAAAFADNPDQMNDRIDLLDRGGQSLGFEHVPLIDPHRKGLSKPRRAPGITGQEAHLVACVVQVPNNFLANKASPARD